MPHKDSESSCNKSALIFGASGAIGGEIVKCLAKSGINVIGVGRIESAEAAHAPQSVKWSLGQKFSKKNFGDLEKIDAVVWAQGANYSDTIADFARDL